MPHFIRVYNSEGGFDDIPLSDAAMVLMASGTDPAYPPTFQLTAGERMPHSFSYNHLWEKAVLDNYGGYDYGRATFTAEFERLASGDTTGRAGPGAYTTAGDRPWALRV